MNVFEFNTYDLSEGEKEFYKPFRYEIPKDGLMSIEDFVAFCKNVAVLLSFTEETFQNGIADYLEQVGYYKDDQNYTPEVDPKKDFTNDIIDKIGTKEVDKILKDIEDEKKFPSTKIVPCDCDNDSPCSCDDKENKNRDSFDE